MNRLALLGILAFAGGCGSKSSEQDYGDRFNETMVAFNAEAVAIAQRPLPSKDLSKEERRRLLAARLREEGASWRRFEQRFQKLKPPSAFAEVNRWTIAFFKTMADDQDQWATLIETASPQRKQFEAQITPHLIEGVRAIVDAMKGLDPAQRKHVEKGLRELEQLEKAYAAES